MNSASERAANQAAYRHLKDTIAAQYGTGRFVAIAEGRVIADAADFEQLRSLVVQQKRKPVDVLIVQAGVDHPENALIFCGDQ